MGIGVRVRFALVSDGQFEVSAVADDDAINVRRSEVTTSSLFWRHNTMEKGMKSQLFKC